MTARTAAFGAVGHGAALLAVYLVTGPARATVLDLNLGPLTGSAVEAAAFVLASLASVALGLSRLQSRWPAWEAITVGFGALLLLAVADSVIAVAVCHVPLAGHFARFATLPGMVQAAALLFHALAPVLWLSEAGGDSPVVPPGRRPQPCSAVLAQSAQPR